MQIFYKKTLWCIDTFHGKYFAPNCNAILFNGKHHSKIRFSDHSGNICFCKNVYLEEKYNHKNGVLGIAFIRIQAFFWLLQSAEYGVLRSERANEVVVVKSIQ